MFRVMKFPRDQPEVSSCRIKLVSASDRYICIKLRCVNTYVFTQQHDVEMCSSSRKRFPHKLESEDLAFISYSWNERIRKWAQKRIIQIETYCSITGPISMGQCEALSAKHSVQTCFRIVFCCCDGNCWKYSLSLACLTHAIKICASTLKFNVWFAASNASGIIVCEIVFDVCVDGCCCGCCCCCCCCFTSSRIFDWIIGFCFRGPRSSCTAF